MPKHNTIAARLAAAELAISNAKNIPEIATALAKFGYDEAKLQEGLDLYHKALELHTAHAQKYGEQHAATAEYKTARTTANELYMKHLKLARIALRADQDAAAALELFARRKESFSGWHDQANTFYTNVLQDEAKLNKLSQLGITKTELQEAKALVDAAESAHVKQQQEKGDAQKSTKLRDQAFDDLYEWYSDLISVARIALADDAQLLEALGVVVPS